MDFDSLINETKISFSCKDLKDDDIVEILAEVLEKSSVVTEIDLMLNQLTLSDDIFTDALAMNKSLKVLNLYNNKIGVEVCIIGLILMPCMTSCSSSRVARYTTVSTLRESELSN
jgi:hypothetical protein